MSPDPIVRVDAWKCVIELPAPFPVGAQTVSSRDYVVVRMETRSGVYGASYGLSRGAPIDLIVSELIAPKILGLDATDPRSIRTHLVGSLPQHSAEGLMLRALSHVDIAAWDIKGKVRSKPVWKMLGSSSDKEAPVLLVEGYHINGEHDAQFAARLGRRAEEGYRALKIEASSEDRRALSRRLEATRQAVGPHVELVLDLAYAWSGVSDFDGEFDWITTDVAWIEDPVHGKDLDRIRRLSHATDVPLGIGDEMTNIDDVMSLIRTRLADVLRVDVTCLGGFSTFQQISDAAHAENLKISTHVYPELHQHVAFGRPGGGPVEMFPDNGLWDATARLLEPLAASLSRDGTRVVRAPSAPGVGLKFDWSAVDKYAVRHGFAGDGPAGRSFR